jgi:predicted MPP superfamily phosphohydrolase
MNEQPNIIWFIHGSKAEARDDIALLASSGQLIVRSVGLRPGVRDYADLVANPETGAILIGRITPRRTEEGYDSIALADFLRALRADLPIFFVTDHHDTDAADAAAAFDAVFKLADIRREPDAYIRRIQRAVGRYTQSLTRHQNRLRELLDRQYSTESPSTVLSNSDLDELEELRRHTERPVDGRLARYIERQNAALREQQNLVDQLEALTEKLDKARAQK